MAEHFTVTSQQLIREPTDSGQFIDAVKISYKLTNGMTGWITVPKTKYNVKTVTDMINEVADTSNTIATL